MLFFFFFFFFFKKQINNNNNYMYYCHDICLPNFCLPSPFNFISSQSSSDIKTQVYREQRIRLFVYLSFDYLRFALIIMTFSRIETNFLVVCCMSLPVLGAHRPTLAVRCVLCGRYPRSAAVPTRRRDSPLLKGRSHATGNAALL